jgi:hypothetical protein
MQCYEKTEDFNEGNLVDDETAKLVKYIETKFDCSGLSEKPKFYVSRSVLDGPPQKDCGTEISSMVDSSINMIGLLMLISAMINFLIWNAQYGLWRKIVRPKFNVVDMHP